MTHHRKGETAALMTALKQTYSRELNNLSDRVNFVMN